MGIDGLPITPSDNPSCAPSSSGLFRGCRCAYKTRCSLVGLCQSPMSPTQPIVLDTPIHLSPERGSVKASCPTRSHLTSRSHPCSSSAYCPPYLSTSVGLCARAPLEILRRPVKPAWVSLGSPRMCAGGRGDMFTPCFRLRDMSPWGEQQS